MPPERLCLGCGVRSDETFSFLPPQDRPDLYKAAVRLMCLVLAEVPPPGAPTQDRLDAIGPKQGRTLPRNIVRAHLVATKLTARSVESLVLGKLGLPPL